MSKKIKIRFFAIISVLFLCFGFTLKVFQNDTFYIIKLGEYIYNHGIDLCDHYCWIINLNYSYPHWLYDLFIYTIYYNFDFFGIYVSTIIFFIILILSIYIINLKSNKNEFLALFISFFSIVILFSFVTARAQLITIILFLWQVYFIEKFLNSGKKRYAIYLVLISWLVANLHATIWLFTFILYLPFFGQQIVYNLTKYKTIKDKVQVFFNDNSKIILERFLYIKELFVIFLLSFFVGLLTPSKICYSYIFKVMLGNSQAYITEHAPMVIIEHPCFIVLVLILLLILIFSDTKIKLKELFMLCGLLFMCFVSVRHVIFFYVIGVFYFSIICNRYLYNKGDKTFVILENILTSYKVIYFGLIVIIGIFSFSKFNENFNKEYVSINDYPVEAVKFIKNNLEVDDLRLYNEYMFGSYLLFNDIPVFVDSRCDLYLREFNGLEYSIFDDAMNITYNYREKFEFYNVSHILIFKKNLLYIILNNDLDYQVIYEDDNFVLFERLSYEKS